jgi:hypothetical protein
VKVLPELETSPLKTKFQVIFVPALILYRISGWPVFTVPFFRSTHALFPGSRHISARNPEVSAVRGVLVAMAAWFELVEARAGVAVAASAATLNATEMTRRRVTLIVVLSGG